MAAFLIGSHGYMASGVEKSLNMLLGEFPNVFFFDAYVDDCDLDEAIEKFYKKIGPEEKVFLIAELFGGSVSNSFCKYMNEKRTTVIAGFNLALLIELIVRSSKQELTLEEINQIVESARSAMLIVSDNTYVDNDENFFEEKGG